MWFIVDIFGESVVSYVMFVVNFVVVIVCNSVKFVCGCCVFNVVFNWVLKNFEDVCG